MRTANVLFFSCLAIVVGAACAEAGTEGLDEDDDDITGLTDSGTTDASTGRKDSGPVSPPRDSGTSSSGGASSGGSSSGGSSGGSSSGGSSGTGTPACNNGSCSALDDLGTILGNSGSESVNTTGKGGGWVKVRVKEKGFTGGTMSYRMVFTPAADTEYDVYVLDVYEDLEGDPGCGEDGDLVSPSSYNSYTNSWSAAIDGFPDDHLLYIHIKQKAGACPSSASWKLRVERN